MIRKAIIALALTILLPVMACAKSWPVNVVYVYGMSASFNDSIIYFTGIQEVKGAWLEGHNFLVNRDEYAYQLRNFLSDKTGEQNRVNIVCYALTRKDAEKKYAKLRRRYTTKAKTKYAIRDIPESEFMFKGVEPDNYNPTN